MAHRPRSFGLTAEVRDKIKNKYDKRAEEECLRWISEVLDNPTLFAGIEGEDAVHEKLKDGVMLCDVMNTIQPGTIRKVNKMKQPFLMMENISSFLQACVAYGVKPADLFQTVDLYEKQNMVSVLSGIYALGRKAQTNGYHGAQLGPRESQENRREFTAEQLNQSEMVIGLQMGSNKGANQSGMNFGKSRDLFL